MAFSIGFLLLLAVTIRKEVPSSLCLWLSGPALNRLAAERDTLQLTPQIYRRDYSKRWAGLYYVDFDASASHCSWVNSAETDVRFQYSPQNGTWSICRIRHYPCCVGGGL